MTTDSSTTSNAEPASGYEPRHRAEPDVEILDGRTLLEAIIAPGGRTGRHVANQEPVTVSYRRHLETEPSR